MTFQRNHQYNPRFIGFVQRGFTLVELVIVIAVLGILAAVALPQYIQITTGARQASISGVNGAVNSAAALAIAKYIVSNSLTITSVNMGPTNGTAVTVATGTGIPAATTSGILLALSNTTGVSAVVSGATMLFNLSPDTSTTTTCQATYTAATGISTVVTSGC